MSQSPNPESNKQNHQGQGDNVAGNKNVTNNYYGTNPEAESKPIETIPHNIPPSNTIKFVGREETIKSLHQQLQDNQQLAITAVKGMGGIGKTELALQYALQYEDEYYKGGVCWVTDRESNIGLQILNFAENNLGIKPPENQSLESQVGYCWSQWQSIKQGEVLLVIDDVTNYKNIKPYLPAPSSPFKVLITTRLNLKGCSSLALDVLDEDKAIALLAGWLGEQKVNEEIEDVKELCLRLGYLPLALNLMGAYLCDRHLSISKILSILDDRGLTHESLCVTEETEEQLALSIDRGVEETFGLSWQILDEDVKELACFLSIFAFTYLYFY